MTVRRLTKEDIEIVADGGYEATLASLQRFGVNLTPGHGAVLLTPRGVTSTGNCGRLKHTLINVLRTRGVKRIAFLCGAQQGAPAKEQKELQEALPLLDQCGFIVDTYGVSDGSEGARTKILDSEVIYLCGGAPLWIAAQLDWLGLNRESLLHFVAGGGLIVASSAGAMALGCNLSGLVRASRLAWVKQAPAGMRGYEQPGLGLIEEQVVPHPTRLDALQVRALAITGVREAVLKSGAPTHVLWDGELTALQLS